MSIFSNIWSAMRSFYESRHEPEYMRPLAEWYWRVLLTTALFALIIIVLQGVWGFYGVMRKLSAGDTVRPTRHVDPLSRKDLSAMLQRMSEREAAYESAKRGRPSVSDPSR